MLRNFCTVPEENSKKLLQNLCRNFSQISFIDFFFVSLRKSVNFGIQWKILMRIVELFFLDTNATKERKSILWKIHFVAQQNAVFLINVRFRKKVISEKCATFEGKEFYSACNNTKQSQMYLSWLLFFDGSVWNFLRWWICGYLKKYDVRAPLQF